MGEQGFIVDIVVDSGPISLFSFEQGQFLLIIIEIDLK